MRSAFFACGVPEAKTIKFWSSKFDKNKIRQISVLCTKVTKLDRCIRFLWPCWFSFSSLEMSGIFTLWQRLKLHCGSSTSFNCSHTTKNTAKNASFIKCTRFVRFLKLGNISSSIFYQNYKSQITSLLFWLRQYSGDSGKKNRTMANIAIGMRWIFAWVMHGNKQPRIKAEMTPRLYDGSYSELSAPRTLEWGILNLNILFHFNGILYLPIKWYIVY